MSEYNLKDAQNYARNILRYKSHKEKARAFFAANANRFVLFNPDAGCYYKEGTNNGVHVFEATVYESRLRIPQHKPVSWKGNTFIVRELNQEYMNECLARFDSIVENMINGFLETLAKEN